VHIRRVHAEREGGADAHIEDLAKRQEGRGANEKMVGGGKNSGGV
jgi:hypothetical protein